MRRIFCYWLACAFCLMFSLFAQSGDEGSKAQKERVSDHGGSGRQAKPAPATGPTISKPQDPAYVYGVDSGRELGRQTAMASITGHVYDCKGTPINGVHVWLQSTERDAKGQDRTWREARVCETGKDETGKDVPETDGGKGFYRISRVRPGTYELVARMCGKNRFSRQVSLTSGDEIMDLTMEPEPRLEVSRAVLGFEQAGASSAESRQRFFFDLTIDVPLQRTAEHSDLGPRLRAWGTTRVTSVPQQVSTPIAAFVESFPQKVGALKVNEVAQAAEFLAGLEYRLPILETVNDQGPDNPVSLALITGFGAITPLTAKDTLEIYETSAEARKKFNLDDTVNYLAFVSPDRDRFYRQFYGGLRLKTRFFENGMESLVRAPSSLDVTYGFNESVTGGRIHGGVFRLEGFFTLPVGNTSIFLFGTALFKPGRSQILDPLILKKAEITLPRDDAAIRTLPSDRDYYRLGVGIDLVRVVTAWAGGKKSDGETSKSGKDKDGGSPKPAQEQGTKSAGES